LRVFVAMDVPEEVLRNIAQLMKELVAVARGARWVRTEGMHVTLKFIGEASREMTERVKSSLADIHSASPIEVSFRGMGCFPNERRPRVLWAGIEASGNLAELAAEVETRLATLGIPREERTFRPHLTLARFNEPQSQLRLAEAMQRLSTREFGAMRTSELHLYQSKLKPGGAEYMRLATFNFVLLSGPPAQAGGH
jgi:RNA 2',3'-cyclic 3'-phosphodiesterase